MPVSARASSTPSPKKSCPRCARVSAATESRSRAQAASNRKCEAMANGLFARKKPDSCTFVIFGVTGDLTHRLVMPSLYNLAAVGLLPEKFCLVGVARKGQSDDELRDSLMKGRRQFATRPVDDDIARKLLECVTFVEADAKD